MRLLVLTEAFPPETKSASTLFFELAESLVKKGFDVTVITRKPRYNVASGTDVKKIPEQEVIAGIKVHRCQTLPLARNIPLVRGFEHFLLGLTFFLRGMRLGQYDAILVYSPPLPLGIAGYWLGRAKKCPVVVNIQDLYPQTVIDLGLLKNKFLIWLSRCMEKFIYQNSDVLTVHSEGNKAYVSALGAKNVVVVHNWVDTTLIKPEARDNDFSKKNNLKDKFIVSFAGVMGFAQGLDVVISAADLLKGEKELLFVLVGDGIKKPELKAMAKEKGLKNVLFVPTLPVNLYPQILHSSDICLITLRYDLVTPVVPGKLPPIMAAGKPVIASVPLNGDAPKIITNHNCGLVVEPANPQALANAVMKLYNDGKLLVEMGQRGREAAVKEFSRPVCIEKYVVIFNGLRKKTNGL